MRENTILLLTVFAAVYCQYPEQRAPPLRHRPPPEEYDEYVPPPRQAPPPQAAFRPNPRAAEILKPASVHYVNIGLELAGDYKFGYDTGKGDDQSFREETRLPDGTVQGAYGYIDETGRQRIVKYTAGKDGFKAQGDVGPEGAPKVYPAPGPAQAQPAPRSAPQPAYAPQPAPRAAPQPAYVPQPAPRPQPQPAYRPPPPAQQAYSPPPQPQPAYRAPEPEYRPRPRQQAPRPRPAPRPIEAYEEPDYDYPNNEIGERRLAPVDTSLFTYNIGTSQDKRN